MDIFHAALLLLTKPLALAIGFIPVLVWLAFWQREDTHSEPKRLILVAFLAGMLSVFIVYPLERFIAGKFSSMVIVFILWAAIEEVIKFLMCYFAVLRRRDNDEPVDSIMYLIATALGFAALENAFFLLEPSLTGGLSDIIVTGNFRFIGATLLHTVASGTIGICLAFSFYKTDRIKKRYLVLGLVLATVLHALFNLSIIYSEGSTTIFSFYAVWIAIVCMLLLFEKVKHITKPQQ